MIFVESFLMTEAMTFVFTWNGSYYTVSLSGQISWPEYAGVSPIPDLGRIRAFARGADIFLAGIVFFIHFGLWSVQFSLATPAVGDEEPGKHSAGSVCVIAVGIVFTLLNSAVNLD
jgi:hypothetical protein